MEEKIERVNNDLENNWWNYEIILRERIQIPSILKNKILRIKLRIFI